VPFAQRASLLRRAAALCHERLEEMARLMTLEMGKRIAEGREEVKLCARIFEYYAHRAEEFLRPQTLPSPLGDGTLLNEPLGVLFGIQPWNYPCYQVVRFAALLKHSTTVQQCAEAIDLLFRDANFPMGAYTNLVITAGLANKVIDDGRV
jgi:succinate-semialdehyde dehydrogenase/glutarate-semialdehyde dehydrogenase